ncbi:MAG: hypothetical protein ACRD0Q_00525 [Acidimicrobiales bacterium]
MRAAFVILMSTGLSMLLAACSPDDGAEGGRAGTDAGSIATAPGAPGPGEGQAEVATEPGTQAGRGAGGASSGAGQPTPSPIIDVRGTVASVDRTAGLIRLTAADSDYSVIEVTPSTEYRRSEGESAVLADVVPGSEVVGTGLGQNGRLRSRLVTILTY